LAWASEYFQSIALLATEILNISCAMLVAGLQDILLDYLNCAGTGVAFKTYNFNKNLPHSLDDFTRVLMVCKLRSYYSTD
jgi:hypothetical protein